MLLYNNNFENNINIAIANTKIKTNSLYGGYIYNNIDNEKQNLVMKLISTIDNIKLTIMVASYIIVSIIIYHSKGYHLF